MFDWLRKIKLSKLEKENAKNHTLKEYIDLESVFISSPPVVSIKLIVGAVAFIFMPITLILLQSVGWDVRLLPSKLPSEKTISFIVQIYFSIVTSIVAAIIFARFQSLDSEKRLKTIISLADVGLIRSMLTNLQMFKHRTLQNYDVRINLRPSNIGSIIICQIDYSYFAVNRPSRILNFEFIRLNSDIRKHGDEFSSNVSSGVLSTDEKYITSEFNYILDETTIESIISVKLLDGMYDIRNLTVNGKPLEIEYQKQTKDSGRAIIDQSIDMDKPVSISYTVEFPLEFSSFITVLMELPTKSFRCRIDYRELINKIELLATDFVGIRTQTNMSQGKLGEITFDHPDWTFPRSGVTIVWWEKSFDESRKPI
jgi:hypothetical protein